jgi:hypothetical protein
MRKLVVLMNRVLKNAHFILAMGLTRFDGHPEGGALNQSAHAQSHPHRNCPVGLVGRHTENPSLRRRL